MKKTSYICLNMVRQGVFNKFKAMKNYLNCPGEVKIDPPPLAACTLDTQEAYERSLKS